MVDDIKKIKDSKLTHLIPFTLSLESICQDKPLKISWKLWHYITSEKTSATTPPLRYCIVKHYTIVDNVAIELPQARPL